MRYRVQSVILGTSDNLQHNSQTMMGSRWAPNKEDTFALDYAMSGLLLHRINRWPENISKVFERSQHHLESSHLNRSAMDFPEECEVRRIGLREVAYSSGRAVQMRKVGTTKWEPYAEPESATVAAESTKDPAHLFVIRRTQASGQHHWVIYITDEDDPCNPGIVYQVTGDHTFMTYEHIAGVNIFNDAEFADHWDLGPVPNDWVDRIREAVDSVAPPQASTLAQVKGNCQTWVIEVVQRLVAAGLLEERWIAQLEAMRN